MTSYNGNREFIVSTEEITNILPVNDDEFARKTTVHFLHKKIWDETNFSAPITRQLKEEYGFNVLDVGDMKSYIPINDWSKTIGELIRVTKPNGWLELIESDNGFTNGSPESLEFLDKVEKKINDDYGLTYSPFKVIKDVLKEYSNILTDVQFLKKKVPLSGHWDNDFDNNIAKVACDNVLWGAKNHKHSLDCLDLTPDGYDDYINKVFESLKD
ncbi:14484_t:CDS:2, partial [Entrophospora sp. SA101]